MKKLPHHIVLLCSLLLFQLLSAQPSKEHNLFFDSLAKRWDEGIPLGNGWLGALIWQKADKLRMSLDRIDLWDDRPMPEIDKLKFSWVIEKVKLNQYDSVQKLGDEPYEKYPAPTKIPGAALEFDLNSIGTVVSNELDIANGLSVIKFSNGIIFNNYIHAVNQVGYFGFENLSAEAVKNGLLKKLIPELMVPNYNSGGKGTSGNSVEGQGLEKLGYLKGKITRTATTIRYHQPTWKNNYYEVLIRWQILPGNRYIGQWTITTNKVAQLPLLSTTAKEPTGWISHSKWWKDYWGRSSVTIPDKQLERQYYLEMYKFACVARANTPPISLQAIWTADNGNLPPWKGDYHHDLNTQLSYWPGYSGNHLDLTAGYTNWLWKVKDVNRKWTKNYFGLNGLNVPGVTTISGKEMGGWIQYSMSPTTAAWLAQHFYWQWKYSMNNSFLSDRAYKYVESVHEFMYNITHYPNSSSSDTFPISSSPEYNNNSVNAWFREFTNYDLSLVILIDKLFLEMFPRYMGDTTDLGPVDNLWHHPMLNYNESGLTIAPGQNLDESHRHHAHLMAIHPLGLLSEENSAANDIIKKSLRHLEKIGTREWCGYSFSWAACIYARAKEADNAVKNLQIFASNFCSPNSFHLNGDQKGGQYSNFTYRPFTLEGNFAFAQGVHELLIQSHKKYIEIFPAIPTSWKNVSFKTLRTEGAFLVSASKENGVIDQIKITAEAGGMLSLKLPLKTWIVEGIERASVKIGEHGIASIDMEKGQTIIFKNGYE